MNFNNNDKYKLNIEEFKEAFRSYMYLLNYKKTLIKFKRIFSKIVSSESKLKQYIKTHFMNIIFISATYLKVYVL